MRFLSPISSTYFNTVRTNKQTNKHTTRGGRRIRPARGKRAAFSINPGHAPCNYTTNWAGIRGFGPGCPPLGPPLHTTIEFYNRF